MADVPKKIKAKGKNLERGKVDYVSFAPRSLGEGSVRVGMGITPHPSHRSGLAQLRHPARQATVLLPAPLAAVVSLTRDPVPEHRPCFLPTVPQPGASFPPSGPAGWFPDFTGTMRRSDSLRTFSPRFVCASLGDTVPCVCVRVSDQVRRRPGAGSFAVWQPPCQHLARRSRRASQVPGGSLCASALFSDPGRIRHPWPWRSA
jgi:hypothetical protein